MLFMELQERLFGSLPIFISKSFLKLDMANSRKSAFLEHVGRFPELGHVRSLHYGLYQVPTQLPSLESLSLLNFSSACIEHRLQVSSELELSIKSIKIKYQRGVNSS